MPAPLLPCGRALPTRLLVWLPFLALTLLAVRPVLAVPVSSSRPVVATRPRAWQAPQSAAPVAETGFACGSSRDRVLDVLASHAAALALAPTVLPTTQSYDHGDIAVLEDDGTLFVPSTSGHVEADEVAVARAFYRTHGDDYDYLCIYTASSVPSWVIGGHATAFELNVHQDVQGLGLGLFDYSLDFGSLGGHLH